MLLTIGILLIISFIAAVTKIKWIPYPSFWLKALGLAVPTWIGAVGVLSLMYWQFIFLFLLANIDRLPILDISLVFAVAVLIVNFILYLLLILLYSLLLRLLWSEVPQFLQWIKPPKKKRDILFGWVVSILATLIPALILLPFTSYSYYSSERFSEIMRKLQHLDFTDETIVKIFVTWYVSAAYLYQVRGLLMANRRSAPSRVTAKSTKHGN